MAQLWVLLFVVIMLVSNVTLFLGVRFALCARRSAAGMLGGRSAWNGASVGRRVLFTVAGPLACYAMAVLWFMVAASFGTEAIDGTRVGDMVGDGDAKSTLQAGDRVLRVGGAPVASWDDIRARVAASGDVVELDVERDGSTVRVTRPKRANGKLGIMPAMHHQSASAASVVKESVAEPLHVIVLGVRKMLAPRVTEYSGPIGRMLYDPVTPQFDGIRVAARATGMWNTALWLLSLFVALALVPRGALKTA